MEFAEKGDILGKITQNKKTYTYFDILLDK